MYVEYMEKSVVGWFRRRVLVKDKKKDERDKGGRNRPCFRVYVEYFHLFAFWWFRTRVYVKNGEKCCGLALEEECW